LAGTGLVKRGPKAQPKDVRDKRIAELERETRQLKRKLAQAETIIGIQKKVATLLGIPLKSVDDDEND
jgi:type II secretory pathway component PulJ